MLTNEEITRYSRQLLVEAINEEGQYNLSIAHVVIIGLGGLGSLAARLLAGAGVGTITLVDGDVVEMSNLARQVPYNEMHLGELKTQALRRELNKVNPKLTLHIKSLFADKTNLPGIIANATCVLDCTDEVKERKQINEACAHKQLPLFIAAASGCMWQAVNLSYQDPKQGCYACLVSQINVREDCTTKGVLGSVVAMAACHQATQALLFLANKAHANIQWGQYLVYDTIKPALQTFSLSPSPHCEVCQ